MRTAHRLALGLLCASSIALAQGAPHGGGTGKGGTLTGLTGDVSTTGTGVVTATVNSVGGSTAANVNTATTAANAATNANTVSTIVKRDSSGNFTAGTITATLSGNATSATTATTATSATTATTATNFSGSLTGDVTGTQGATVVATVGTSTAANVHAAELLANAAVSANTVSTIVKRDSSGNFSAGTITATLTGNATNVSGTVAIANGGTGQTTAQTAIDSLAGAVTSTQYLRGNGTHVVMAAIQAGDVPTLNQNTSGSAASLSATLAIGSGGTGQVTAQAAVDALLPTQTSNSGKYLTTNGTTSSWGTVSSGGVTTMAAIGSSPNANSATISGSTLTIQPASASFGGIVTADGANQTFNGVKFTNGSFFGLASNAVALGASDNVNFSWVVTPKDSAHTTVGTDNTGKYWTLQSDNHVDVLTIRGGHTSIGSSADNGTDMLQVTGSSTTSSTIKDTVASGSDAFEATEGAQVSFNGSTSSSFIKGDATNHGIQLQSNSTNNASAIGFKFNTANTLNTGGGKYFDFQTNGTTKMNMDTGDTLNVAGSAGFTGANGVAADIFQSKTAVVATVEGQAGDGASAIGVKLRTAGTYSTLGSLLLRVDNNTTMKASIDKDGNFKSASHLTCAMSTSTSCTATIPTGSVCHCQANGTDITGGASACSVSSTTATCTATVNNSSTWNIWPY